MCVQLLTEYNLKFVSLKGGYTGSSESTPVKIPHCWKSYLPLKFRKCHKIQSMSSATVEIGPLSIYLRFHYPKPKHFDIISGISSLHLLLVHFGHVSKAEKIRN